MVEATENAGQRAVKALSWAIIAPMMLLSIYKWALVKILIWKLNYREDTAWDLISKYWFKNIIWQYAIYILCAAWIADTLLRYILLNQKFKWYELVFGLPLGLTVIGILASLLSEVLPSSGMDPNLWVMKSVLS